MIFKGAGSGKQDEEDKAKSSPSPQTVPVSSSKDNVARSLFDKANIDDNEASIVPERGEPEGESKQPVVAAQRQVRLKSRKARRKRKLLALR